ncbi:MAG: gliding motility-associated ABC transporter substrate-binding protein GldG [Bacteroidales bacterium]
MEKKKLNQADPAPGRLRNWLQFGGISIIALAIWLASSVLNIRIDLTEDHRYTLSEPTKRILSELGNDVYIQIYLDGDMPVQFRKLRRSVKETLEEFRIESGRHVDYDFINPSEGNTGEERNKKYLDLARKGLSPMKVQSRDAEGGASQKIIFPGMIINYNGIEIPYNFLRNDQSVPADINFQHSIEGLEYGLIQTIATITSDSIKKVVFIEGHGEYSDPEVGDLTAELSKYFTIDRGEIGGRLGVLDRYSVVIIAGPTSVISDADRLAIDQYIMNGGKVLWLVEEVNVNADSLALGETVALYKPLGLEEQIFRYGIRINPSLVQQIECLLIPMKVVTGNQQQIVPVPWLYYPLLYPSGSHPVTRNLNRIAAKFTGYIDTVGLDPAIKKTVLVSTSPAARLVSPPLLISLKETDNSPDPATFTKASLPVAVLLEGKFNSAFRNRPVNDIVTDKSFRLKQESINTKMILVADPDIMRNDVKRVGNNITPLPLGQDKFTMQVYGNRDFLVNAINYLADDNGLLELRSREVKLRLLDRKALREDRVIIKILNTGFPVLLVLIAGFLYNFYRKKRYSI